MKNKISIFIFLTIASFSILKIISVTPIKDIQNDIAKGYLLGEKIQPIITKVTEKSENLGLKTGDTLTTLNGDTVANQLKIREFFIKNRGNNAKIELIRNNETINLEIDIPKNFQSFGYESDFNFIDREIIEKSNLEIIFYHLYSKGFEVDPNFPTLNKNVFIFRTVNYLGSLGLIIISYILLFKTRYLKKQINSLR